MTDPKITAADRELLAEEYERSGWPKLASDVRAKPGLLPGYASAALRAIARARTEASRMPPVGGDAVEAALDAFHPGWRNCPSELRVIWLKNMPHMIAAADAARGVSWVRWQTIDSAPKNEILDLWWSGHRYCHCYYDHICDEWRTSRPAGRLFTGIKPSHWMRPPKSPEAEMPIPPAWSGEAVRKDSLHTDATFRAWDANCHHANTGLRQAPCPMGECLDEKAWGASECLNKHTANAPAATSVLPAPDLATARCGRPGGCDRRGSCLTYGVCLATGERLDGSVPFTREMAKVLYEGASLVAYETKHEAVRKKMQEFISAAFPEPPR